MDVSERVDLAEVLDLIQVGEPLPFRVLDAQGRLLLGEGHRVTGERQLEALIERGAWAERPAVEQARAARAAAAAARAPSPPPPPTLFDRWERKIWVFDDLSRRLVRGQAMADELPPFVDTLLTLVDCDADVALFTCMRQDDRRFALYAVTHGIHTAVLATLAGRQAGMDPAAVRTVALAALSMNLSIMELQATLAEQSDPPSARQREAIRAHPSASADLLRQRGVTQADWLEAVQDHHEQAGGGGYPHQRAEVGPLAALLHASDVFMAKVSPRAKRPAMAPQLAGRQLFQQSGGSPLAMAVIRAIGVHPPGSLVTLKSGETAVVTRRGAGPAPRVATLTDTAGRPSVQTHMLDTAEPAHAVTGVPPDPAVFGRVLPERVYGLIPG